LARKHRTTAETVRRATGSFRKKGGRWISTRSDRVERYLQTFEHGARKSVLVADSRTATLLSRHANAIRHYIETGDQSGLREFGGKTYLDAAGKIHRLETDPAKIRAAIERSEADFGAFGDLYTEPEEADDIA
jgi:hypothetical protein